MLWNNQQIDALKSLWAEGLSASQIAYRLSHIDGDGKTRNAVIGKVHRLGLSGRTTITRLKSGPKPRPIKIDRGGAGFAGFKRAKPPVPPLPQEELSLYKQRILALPPTVHGLEAFDPSCQCGFIHGEPSDQARCGRPKVDGLPYCEDHAELCTASAAVARPYPSNIGFYSLMKADTAQFKAVEEFVAP